MQNKLLIKTKEFQIMNVAEFYQKYKNVLILHGLSPIGALNNTPHTMCEKVTNCIVNSPIIHCFSLLSGFNLPFYSQVGLIVKQGEIINASIEDSGYTKNNYPALYWQESQLKNILDTNRKEYNDVIVKNAKYSGIYFIHNHLDIFKLKDIALVCKEFELPIYVLNEAESYFTVNWDYSQNKLFSKQEILSYNQISF